MLKVSKDWWKYFFNGIYLITDARSVCNPSLTCKEVTLLERLLDLKKDDRILDLCGGQGRHSLELARRGYRDVTVLDYSSYLTGLGRRLARKSGFNVQFLRRDARSTKLQNDCYTIICIMANSFGYFPNESDNLKVLKESYRMLKKGGKLLLDLADPQHVKINLKPFSWHEASNDIIVYRQREICKNLIKAREIVISKKDGLLRDDVYCERIYSKNNIIKLLKSAGFKKISVLDRVSLHNAVNDYGLLTSRMFVAAVKT